ncbi:MAG: hypothetical protein H0T93_05715 [Chloroflexia bacterium]|jgi:hypothetical protein|nr:hypothetical protein [Chloroflexia bacterium]
MGALGCGLALLATMFMLLGLIPLLGWLNWFTSLPLALVATVLFYLELREPPRLPIAQAGFLLSVVVLCIVVFRLVIGGGLI